MRSSAIVGVMLALCLGLCGCTNEVGTPPNEDKKDGAEATNPTTSTDVPSFSIAASEYPSWSTLMVAAKLDLINSEKGKQGSLEKKYNVDVVLMEDLLLI